MSTVTDRGAAASTELGVRGGPRTVAEAPSGRTTGWWGMMLFICTESATFAAFLASYFYLRFADATKWPPLGDKPPHLVAPSIGTGVLILSCVSMALGVRAAVREKRVLHFLLLLVTLFGGLAFVALQGLDYTQEYPASTISKDAYGSLMYSITGLHAFHVMLGVFMLLLLLGGTAFRPINRARAGSARVVAMYWYFLSVLAVAVFGTVYISPYL
jgi:heme/copper-type cytochrome/quinol oxidase subunit 3